MSHDSPPETYTTECNPHAHESRDPREDPAMHDSASLGVVIILPALTPCCPLQCLISTRVCVTLAPQSRRRLVRPSSGRRRKEREFQWHKVSACFCLSLLTSDDVMKLREAGAERKSSSGLPLLTRIPRLSAKMKCMVRKSGTAFPPRMSLSGGSPFLLYDSRRRRGTGTEASFLFQPLFFAGQAKQGESGVTKDGRRDRSSCDDPLTGSTQGLTGREGEDDEERRGRVSEVRGWKKRRDG